MKVLEAEKSSLLVQLDAEKRASAEKDIQVIQNAQRDTKIAQNELKACKVTV